MITEIISCRTIERELHAAMNSAGLDYPVHFVESGLHNVPNKLNQALQELLYSLHCDRVLLIMGFCGNSIANLQTGDYELLVPRVDDCISLLLGYGRRQQIMREAPTYFLSKGWLEGERNIWEEYCYTINKYGEETGKAVFDMMFSHYRRLSVLDDGCFPLEEMIPETQRIAKVLGLEHQVMKADCENIISFLTGPWTPENSLCFAPHTVIKEKDLTIPRQ